MSERTFNLIVNLFYGFYYAFAFSIWHFFGDLGAIIFVIISLLFVVYSWYKNNKKMVDWDDLKDDWNVNSRP